MICLLTLGFAGCSAPTVKHSDQEETGPEAQFVRFEKELRRLCQEGNATLIADATGGTGLTSIRTAMDPPTAVWHPAQTSAGEETAEVTIVTRLTYSSLAPETAEEESPSQIKAPKKTDTGLLGTEEKETAPVAAVRSIGKQEEFRDTYDLAYRNNRWELVSREVPESMRMMLERALSAQ